MNDKLSYWEQRAANLTYNLMKKAEDEAEELNKLYVNASRWLNAQSLKIFMKYMRKHSLTLPEARRLLSQMKDSTSVDELVNKLSDDPRNKELVAELESNAYQHRIGRLQELQRQLDDVMTNVFHAQVNRMDTFLSDLAKEAYYRNIFNIQQRAGLGFSFATVNERHIKKVLSMNWSGSHYSERLWRNTQELAKRLKEELLINLVTGRTERELADALSYQFNVGRMKARRLVRTESSFVSGELCKDSYEECEVERYLYVATLDLRTSEVCRELDGKIFYLKDAKVGVNYNPMHPWCRSTTIAYFDEETLSKMQRRALDPVTGDFVKVPASMNYKEWYQKYVENDPIAQAQEKALKNKSADKKQFQKYKNVLREESPKTIAEFQKIKYTKPEKWKELKHTYSIVNKYEFNSDNKMPVSKIVELDKIAKEAYLNFTGTARKKANTAVIDIDGKLYISNSQLGDLSKDDVAYTNYTGNKDALVGRPETQTFQTKHVGTSQRNAVHDAEYKLFEYARNMVNDDKKHTVYLLSQKNMCESCKGVTDQFIEEFENVDVYAVSYREDLARKNKNNPWKGLKLNG